MRYLKEKIFLRQSKIKIITSITLIFTLTTLMIPTTYTLFSKSETLDNNVVTMKNIEESTKKSLNKNIKQQSSGGKQISIKENKTYKEVEFKLSTKESINSTGR